MPLVEEFLPHYTYEDYKHWEGRWELIKGIPYAMSPSPNFIHQKISSKIARILEEELDNCPHYHALISFDYKISEDTVLQPDNLVICYEPENYNYLTRPPELIIEILSSSTIKKDLNLKYDIYEKEGVKYYVVVFPEEKKVKIFQLINKKYQLIGEFKDKIFEFKLTKCKIQFDFSRIWG